jgi:hypothetical protein
VQRRVSGHLTAPETTRSAHLTIDEIDEELRHERLRRITTRFGQREHSSWHVGSVPPAVGADVSVLDNAERAGVDSPRPEIRRWEGVT